MEMTATKEVSENGAVVNNFRELPTNTEKPAQFICPGKEKTMFNIRLSLLSTNALLCWPE